MVSSGYTDSTPERGNKPVALSLAKAPLDMLRLAQLPLPDTDFEDRQLYIGI